MAKLLRGSLPRPANRHRVPKKQWAKWTDHGRRVFNGMMVAMREQALYSHVDAQRRSKEAWRVTCWNAAWTAATLASLEA